MPKPQAGESEEKYISRCMGDEEMNGKYPDNDQRAAVCYTYWDKHTSGKDMVREDFAYNEGQPRASDGKWTSGGGDSASSGGDSVGEIEYPSGDYIPDAINPSSGLPTRATSSQVELTHSHPDAAWTKVKKQDMARANFDDGDDSRVSAGESAANFARLDNVELFASGSWNGLSFSDKDLDGIVSSFDALGLSGRVPLKLGHDGPDVRRDPSTQLAMGWVQSVKRVGNKIVGSIEVPDKVRQLFKDGFLKFVSVELLKDVKASTRSIPWVLDAVALLGSDQPAVGILADLQTVSMSRSELEYETCVSFARADYVGSTSYGDISDMSDNTALKELSERMLALSAQVNDLQAENRSLKSRDAEFAQTRARFERLQDDVKRRDINAHREKITGRVESAVKAEDITPAARERFNKVYRVDDDTAVMTISLDDVEEFVRENPNPGKKSQRKRVFTSLASPDADIPMDVPVDTEAAMRVEAFLRQGGVKKPTDQDIQAAAVAIFRSNPELGARYKANADAQYGK